MTHDEVCRDCLALAVPREHPCFAGHFPGDPLVPGALLLAWLQRLVQTSLPDCELRCVSSFKFLQPVRPGDTLSVEVERAVHDTVVSLQVRRGAALVARGRFALDAPRAVS